MRTGLKVLVAGVGVLVVAGVVACVQDVITCREPSFDGNDDCDNDYDGFDDSDVFEDDFLDEECEAAEDEQAFLEVCGVTVDEAITQILGETDTFTEDELKQRDITTLAKTYFSYCVS